MVTNTLQDNFFWVDGTKALGYWWDLEPAATGSGIDFWILDCDRRGFFSFSFSFTFSWRRVRIWNGLWIV